MREQILKSTNYKRVFRISMAVVTMVLIVGMGFLLKFPTDTLILDVNPSIEIKTNGLKKVIGLKPLNEDGRDLLKGFKLEDRDVEDVVENLVDRMILTGHIAGGKDNLVMITVDDNNANKEMIDKVNQAISAYLQNRQLEAAILNQSIDMNDEDFKIAKEKDTSPGKLKIIKRIMANDKNLTYDDLVSISLKDLLSTAKRLEINPEHLFDSYVGILGKNHVKDDDKDDILEKYDDKERVVPEIKIEAESVSKSTKKHNKKAENKINIISSDEAKTIALKLANGRITEFELDEDDGRLVYEIEIKTKDVEHEIEIDAYTGKVLEHEIDD